MAPAHIRTHAYIQRHISLCMFSWLSTLMKKTPDKIKHSDEKGAKRFIKDSPARCRSVTVQRFIIASQVHPSNRRDRNMMAQHVEMGKENICAKSGLMHDGGGSSRSRLIVEQTRVKNSERSLTLTVRLQAEEYLRLVHTLPWQFFSWMKKSHGLLLKVIHETILESNTFHFDVHVHAVFYSVIIVGPPL